MWFLWFLGGIVVGAIGAVIYYRRHVVEVEEALKDAASERDKFKALWEKVKGDG